MPVHTVHTKIRRRQGFEFQTDYVQPCDKYNLIASQNKPPTTVVKYLKSKDNEITLPYQNKVIQGYMAQRQCKMINMKY